ncbi:hypothetical protein [Cryobacterium shii]|uniref:Uncharacterized protein n=1 Tax=Cryobacterium shii TaxID=1259235 RepID=A0AAQ2HFP4_9MICO|nr:hypothetical protein [Cryobacterium shii]TFC48902.1 hypothetical protein E3O49_06745 [Cryobacterium shii]
MASRVEHKQHWLSLNLQLMYVEKNDKVCKDFARQQNNVVGPHGLDKPQMGPRALETNPALSQPIESKR